MTIKEALKTLSENLTVSDGKLDLALINAGLIGTTLYTPEDEQAIDMVYVTLLLTSITISELKEDDVSIKYTADLKGIVSAIYRKWVLVDPFAIAKPKVKQVQIW
ncbi:MAG: hypothetical protein EOO88_48230 [Pedobacter sp.]|nr:MAG: hypothetical protein EOO88_48230 [Pedobacter sp.]